MSEKVFEDNFPLDDFPSHQPTNRLEKVLEVTRKKGNELDVPSGKSIAWTFDAETGDLEMYFIENTEVEI